MSLIARSLDRADERADLYRSESRSRIQVRAPLTPDSGGLGGAVASAPASATSLGYSRYSQTSAHHAEQYQYNRGYPYAIINMISNRLAAQPIRVGRVLPAGEKARKRFRPFSKDFVPKSLQDIMHRIELYPEHRITDAINNPNPLMVRHHLLYATFASIEITGRGFWWMYRDDETGQDQIWPVPSHWIEPYHAPNKLFAHYKVMLPGAGEPIKVPTRQIVPFLQPDPSDPFGALSVLQALASTVMADFSIETSQRMSFENGINPGLAIMVGKPPEFAGVGGDTMVLTKPQRDQIIGAVRRQYRGVTRFEEPLILDALIRDVKPITTSPKEMAYRDSGTITRNRLTQGWGMNPIVMGEMEGANYASSGVADHHVCRGVYQPRAEANSQTMTCYLPPYFGGGQTGEKLIVYQEPPQPDDPELTHRQEMDHVTNAIRNRDEVRQRHGLSRINDGDKVLVQGNWVSVTPVDANGAKSEGPRREKEMFGRPWRWPYDSLAWRLISKVRDDNGAEHDADGRFGSGGGGGSSSSGSPRTGSVHDSDKQHAKRAKKLAAKIKKYGDKAVAAGKAIKVKAQELSARVGWALMNSPIKPDDILDTAHDYSKITYHRDNYLTQHLGVGANAVAVVASHLFAYGIVKVKQAIRAKGESKGGEKPTVKERARAVTDVLHAFLPAIGTHEEDLPSYREVLKWMKKKEADQDDDEDDSKGHMPFRSKAASAAVEVIDAGHERAYEDVYRATRSTLRRLGRIAMKEVRKALKESDHASATEIAHRAVPASAWAKELRRAMKQAITEACLHGAATEWALYRMSEDRGKKARKPVPKHIPQQIIDVAQRVADKLLNNKIVEKIVGWFRRRVQRAVGDGLADGGPSEAARRTTEVLGGASMDQAADDIADNQGAAAVNGGQDGVREVLAKRGAAAVSVWITKDDEKVRPAHAQAHGQRVAPGKPFIIAGHEAKYPGDPALPPGLRRNCRCKAVTIYPGKDGDDVEITLGIGEGY